MKKLLLIISINFLNLNGMHNSYGSIPYPSGQINTRLQENPFLNTQITIVEENNAEEIKDNSITIKTHFNRLTQNLSCFMLEGNREKLTFKKIYTYQSQNEKLKSFSHTVLRKPVIGLLFLSSNLMPNTIKNILEKTDDFIKVDGPLAHVYANTYYSVENTQFSKYYGCQIIHQKVPLFLYLETTKYNPGSSLPLTVLVEDYPLGYSQRAEESNNNNNQIPSNTQISSTAGTIPQLIIISASSSQLPNISSFDVNDLPPALEEISSTEDKNKI